ncbi:exported hypothetical protein [Syntrophobacter sp. SbD1]|nr:exported hypothetical protein [Syntrophobacter sp. SbD1]
MKRKVIFIALLILAITNFSFALGTPDFSGTWVLNPEKSDTGLERPGAGKLPTQTITLVIKQTGTTLSVERKTSDEAATVIFKLDGTESTNKAPNGKDIKSTSTWVGSTLVTKSTMVMDEMTEQVTVVRSLSADGKVMTIQVTRQTPRGEIKQTLIYNKQ